MARQDEELIAITTSLGADKLYIDEIHGEERLSEPFCYILELFSEDETLDASAVVGQTATIRVLQGDDSTTRYINGVITSFMFRRVDMVNGRAFFRAELRPTLWSLSLQSDCRIFQEKSTAEIVKAVLGDASVTLKDSLKATYNPRTYCVQYNESHLNFIQRLMEEEGIYYFFEHADGAHTMVLADDSDAFKDCPGGAELSYRANRTERNDDTVLFDVQLEEQVTTGSWGLDDFHFETPSTDLYAKSDGTKPTNKKNAYPGGYTVSADGEKLALVRLQAEEVYKKLIKAEDVDCRALRCGYKFKLKDHPRDSLNGDWVLWSVKLFATRKDYKCAFVGFPKDTPFRATGGAVKPVIPSTQTAFVVGKSGEEIWTDEYGRIKVQFHWDRVGVKDENSSCWIRVAQGWAGKSWGAWFLPRIGMEVVVSFLDGDPDRPLVTGCVYNAERTVPYALPDNQTQSTIKSQSSKNGTGKFNEIRFEDKLDSEEIYIHGQKDLNMLIENDVKREIMHDETTIVTNDCKLQVDHDNTIVVKNNRSREVTEGNDTLDVKKGTRAVTVKGDETHTNEAKFTHSVKGDYALTVDGKMDVTVKGALTLKADSITIETTSGAYKVKSAAALELEATADLKGKGVNAKFEGSANVELKGGAQFKAEGAMFEVKGSGTGTVDGGGMLTVKGGLVKIN